MKQIFFFIFREAMILNLKKRVDILTNENTQLRNLLKKNDNNQTTTTGTTSIVQAQQPIAPIRNGSRKISAKSISDYDIQDDLGDTQSIRLVILFATPIHFSHHLELIK